MRAREEESFTAASSTCDLGIDCRSISIMACSAVEITAETTTRTTKEHELARSLACSDILWSHMNNPSGLSARYFYYDYVVSFPSSKHVHVLAFSLAYSRSKVLSKVGYLL